jgi:hypothetical protein
MPPVIACPCLKSSNRFLPSYPPATRYASCSFCAASGCQRYVTKDNIVDGCFKVNRAGLEALRKIAAVELRAIETWGAPMRPHVDHHIIKAGLTHKAPDL